MTRSTDFMREEYTIETPENVSFGYEVAGIGNRFVGALIDVLLLGIGLLLLNILLVTVLGITEGVANEDFATGDISWGGGLVIAIFTLLNFALFWSYFALFELLWKGQTPGKRVAHTQVIRSDGNPVGFLGVAVRNLVRIVDFLPSAYFLGFVTMLLNRRARRLGDFAAGTIVVRLADGQGGKAQRTQQVSRNAAGLSLDDVLAGQSLNSSTETAAPRPGASTRPANPAESDEWILRFPAIRRLTIADYELVQSTLARERTGNLSLSLLRRLSDALAAKLEVEPPQQPIPFLRDVAEALSTPRTIAHLIFYVY